MARALLIAEKPDLMRKVQAVYKTYGHNDDIEFTTFLGHTMTLKEPDDYKTEWAKWDMSKLPMIPEKFEYKPSKDKFKMYNEIKNKIKTGKYDYLINCCDPGREGNAIFHTFYQAIGSKLPVKRMWHSDLTDSEVKRALDNLRDDLKEPALINLTNASLLRAEFDWLIGMNFTRAFRMKTNIKGSVGRVMTPTLKIIVDRELEIKNFKPKDFWEIETEFKTENSSYKGIFFDKSNNTQFFDVNKANEVIKNLQNKGVVVSVDGKREVKYAPPLHSLEYLQNEANETFGYTMNETLVIAQSLYEKELLSYPRTDSSFLTSAIALNFKKLLKPLLSIKEIESTVAGVMANQSLMSTVAKDKKYVDDKNVSDHWAITPTGETPDFNKLTTKEVNIYTMVAKRFLSIFLPPSITNKTTIITEDNGYKFKTTGSVMVDLGYLNIYGTNSRNTVLPNVLKGQDVGLLNSKLLVKKTTAPGRYNDRTLNIALGNAGRFVEDKDLKEVLKNSKGIGTPATRGGIVEKLIDTALMERVGKGKVKYFQACDLGISLIVSIGNHDVTSPKLTGEWEQKLRLIEACQYSVNDFKKEMIEYIKRSTEVFKNMETNGNQNVRESLGVCPKCQKDIVEGQKGYGCSGYKDGCDFVIWKEAFGTTITVKEAKKLLAGGTTSELKCKKKDNTSYTAKFKLGDDHKLTFVQRETNVIGICPKCKKDIVEGQKGFGCSGYKDGCDFVIWKEAFGTKFTVKEVKSLLKNEETSELNCKKRDGTPYTAKFKLGDDHKITFVPR